MSNFKPSLALAPSLSLRPMLEIVNSLNQDKTGSEKTQNGKTENEKQSNEGDTKFSDLIIGALEKIENNTSPKHTYYNIQPAKSVSNKQVYNYTQSKMKLPIRPSQQQYIYRPRASDSTQLTGTKKQPLVVKKRPVAPLQQKQSSQQPKATKVNVMSVYKKRPLLTQKRPVVMQNPQKVKMYTAQATPIGKHRPVSQTNITYASKSKPLVVHKIPASSLKHYKTIKRPTTTPAPQKQTLTPTTKLKTDETINDIVLESLLNDDTLSPIHKTKLNNMVALSQNASLQSNYQFNIDNAKLIEPDKFKVDAFNDQNKFREVLLDTLMGESETISPLQNIYDMNITPDKLVERSTKAPQTQHVMQTKIINKNSPVKQINNFKTLPSKNYNPVLSTKPNNATLISSNKAKAPVRKKLIIPTKYKNHIAFSDNPKLVDHSKLSNDTKIIVPTRYKNYVVFSDEPVSKNNTKVITATKKFRADMRNYEVNVTTTTIKPVTTTDFIDYTRSRDEPMDFTNPRYIDHLIDSFQTPNNLSMTRRFYRPWSHTSQSHKSRSHSPIYIIVLI